MAYHLDAHRLADSAERRFANDNGKLAKFAVAAIMRKPVVLADAPLKANQPWQPKLAA